ncbi:MAG TPA: hypothetical protein VLM42_00875 [Bryobacteraceae bacterium]|nr:hypothetical protein [Bryobacteraceae bacterium]
MLLPGLRLLPRALRWLLSTVWPLLLGLLCALLLLPLRLLGALRLLLPGLLSTLCLLATAFILPALLVVLSVCRNHVPEKQERGHT